MKIGVVTIKDYTNFGNRLQCYASCYILHNMLGQEAVSLETSPYSDSLEGNKIQWIKNNLASLYCRLSPRSAEKKFGNNITRWNNFNRWNRNIPTKIIYGDISIPSSIDDEFDYFCAGSDQIWNYNFNDQLFFDLDNFFLKFATDQKKIALSASFGIESIPENWKSYYRESLSSFANISVREIAGKKIIRDLIKKEVPQLIDPVMVLSDHEWDQVMSQPRIDIYRPYVIKYFLGNHENEEQIENWARNNGYLVYKLMDDKIPELYSSGPGEFLSLIKHAKLVCSDSFHCLAFSILFSVPFIAYSRYEPENDMNSRLKTLLNTFRMEDRWSTLLNEENYLSCDFSNTSEILEIERSRFIDFLKRAMHLI